MRRGSLPRGSAHRLYRSRLPNDFRKLRHHRFRSGSMGNGGERRTPNPKNACGSRVCTPVRCVRSSPGRINRSKHALLSNADASAIQAGSLVVVFVYFMIALFLGRASTEAATSEHAIAAGNARDTPGGNVRGGQQQATKEHTGHVGHARGVPA